jgi:hypothetical protein
MFTRVGDEGVEDNSKGTHAPRCSDIMTPKNRRIFFTIT